jgi:hypothetical protein
MQHICEKELRVIHPATELRYVSEAIGLGVFAKERIPRGTITWTRDPLDRTLRPGEFDTMPPIQQAAIVKYVFADPAGNYLLGWDAARFVNHSCAATCRNVGARFDVAIRDIVAGEQITSDNAELNIAEEFNCLCGAPVCCGKIRPDDRLRLGAAWAGQIGELLPLIESVPQPLRDFVVAEPALRRGRNYNILTNL